MLFQWNVGAGKGHKKNHHKELDGKRLTSGSVHDSLDVKEKRSEARLHQQLVAVVQADAKGKVALQHSLLRTLMSTMTRESMRRIKTLRQNEFEILHHNQSLTVQQRA